ncbi:carbamoyltransferase HypF [Helicobacter mesocricetorum]|uniref:carbamoyltransferase HypF n=1 Tax=Helicobacter mesocricetorum TaxID=87012 RepID=UPI000CF1A37A|nr:carbamoyltransferase HypF [Helicobacter mesocricetorum]
MQQKTFQILIKGIVQGVGFRPFVYKIATRYHLKGYVLNNTQGVKLCIQGEEKNLKSFLKALKNPPNSARIDSISQKELKTSPNFQSFEIKKSLENSLKSAIIPADIALCKKCKKELFNPKNRRYLYPFISCTDCGGRYSLIHSLPYDREKTAMADFTMCKACQKEYENPASRRFHSEINCCQDCGPKLFFTRDFNPQKLPDSKIAPFLNTLENPLESAICALKNGEILAIKGIGGYALVCDARNKDTIINLRKHKNRPKKPFAIMCKDTKMAKQFATLNTQEIKVLNSPIAPILLSQTKDSSLPLEVIAPNLRTLGIILPYAPLHYLLFASLDFPLIFTSANVSGEPLLKDYYQICEKLPNVCDGILLYNRDIVNPIDDSLVRVIRQKTQVLRRARGYLCDVSLPFKHSSNFITLGAQQKSTFTFHFSKKTLLSPHLGDLDNLQSFENFQKTLKLFSTKYAKKIHTFGLDMHPNYSQRHLVQPQDKTILIQHHFAHLLSNIAENSIKEEVLGVIFDGTGYGTDGRIWGGEFLEWNPNNPLTFKHLWHFQPFYLLGGESAIKDTRKLAIEALFVAFKTNYHQIKLPFIASLQNDYGANILEILYHLHQRQNQPLCQSVGRLFDIIASLCGAIEKTSYEGEGGMILESLAKYALQNKKTPQAYTFKFQDSTIFWEIMIQEICNDLKNNIPKEQIALNFHFTLAKIIQTLTQKQQNIALSGGCFQNLILTTLTLKLLKNKSVFLNHQIPCNDGGISFGQAYFMQLLEKNHYNAPKGTQ